MDDNAAGVTAGDVAVASVSDATLVALVVAVSVAGSVVVVSRSVNVTRSVTGTSVVGEVELVIGAVTK